MDAAYESKLAQYNLAQGAAIQSSGYSNANLGAVNQASLAPAPTVANEIISQLDVIHNILVEAAERQKQLLARLHGPRPEEAGVKSGSINNNGALGTISERLTWIQTSGRLILENQQTLERLA